MGRADDDAFRVAVENAAANHVRMLRSEVSRLQAIICVLLGAICFLVLLGVAFAHAQDIEGWISADGYRAYQFKLEKLPPGGSPQPTVAPTPKPTAAPTPAPGVCLGQPLSAAHPQEDRFIMEGQVHYYCMTVPNPVRRLQIEEYDQCLGTNLHLVFTPPPGARYTDGQAVPIVHARSSINLGSTRPPVRHLPAGKYQLQIVGGRVGTNCSGNASKYDLRAAWVE